MKSSFALLLVEYDGDMAHPALDGRHASHGLGLVSLQCRSLVHEDLFHVEDLLVDVRVLRRVGQGALEHLSDEPGGALARKRQNPAGLLGLHPPDEVDDEPRLLRRYPHEPCNSFCFHDVPISGFPVSPPAAITCAPWSCGRRRGCRTSSSARTPRACGPPCSP